MSGGDDITEQKDAKQYDEKRNTSVLTEIKTKYRRIKQQTPR